MYKDTNFVVVTSNLKVKCFGLISISTLYFVAIKNGAFYVLNTSIYKIFLSKFVKLISILDELNDFESFDLTLNDNNNLLELSYDKKLKLFTNKLTSSLNLTYQWFYHYENQWYKIDCNSNSLDIIPPVDDTFSIKLVAYTSIDGVDLKKESNIVNVIVYGPNIEVFLNDEYTFTKGDDIFVVPRIINMDLYKDEIKFKWVYLQNNEWLPFGLQNTNKLEIFDTPYNTNLLRIKLIVKVNNYTFESNESTIKIATIDTIIPNEINIYENDVVKIKPSITLINCDAKNLNYQWQLFNIEHNKWVLKLYHFPNFHLLILKYYVWQQLLKYFLIHLIHLWVLLLLTLIHSWIKFYYLLPLLLHYLEFHSYLYLQKIHLNMYLPLR